MSVRFAMFAAALIVYAALGSPTPDSLGVVEGILALLLAASIGPAAALRPFGIGKNVPPALIPAQALFLYGLSFPLLIGGLAGNDAGGMARDAIPFLFFLLPLLGMHLADTREKARILSLIMVAMGLAFAGRDLVRLTDFALLAPLAADPLSYLANAPTVLFAALMLAGLAGRGVMFGRGLGHFAWAIVLGALAIVPLIVMAAAMQRASLGMMAVVIALWLAQAFYTAPLRAMRLLAPLVILGVLGWPYLEGLYGVLAAKTGAVGLNSRLEELGAIWGAVSSDPLSLLFGLGWGAGFASPAVGGLQVNFAHSLLGAMLLKTGLIGVLFSLFYLAGFIRPLLRHWARDSVLALALLAPFVIDVFLYAAYKSLDFGLILLLIAAAREKNKENIEFGPPDR